MNYKDSAYKVLKMRKKPLHSRKIVQIAIKEGWLKPKGQTPELTMNSQLIRDINSKKEKSRFIKTSPSVFYLNSKFKETKKIKTANTRKKLKNTNTGKIISENFVKNAIISYLSKNDWKIKEIKTLHEKGVDIIAEYSKYSRRFLIEAKGHGKRQQVASDSNSFLVGLGQIITRMKPNTGYYYGLGLPHTSTKTAVRRLPWKVAKELKLFVFSVDSDKTVVKYSWKDLKEKQKTAGNG